jgi:hypothetical protein
MAAFFHYIHIDKKSNMENQVFTQEAREDVLTNHVSELRQIEMEGYELGVRMGRNVLYWIAGLMFVADMLLAYSKGDLHAPVIAFIALVASVFAGLALFTHKKPYLALLLGIVLYITLCGTDIVYSLTNGGSVGVGIVTGLVVRILFTIFLFRALPDARKLERMKAEMA